MIRVVLAVALTVSLLAAAAPGIEYAREADSTAKLDQSVRDISVAAAGLVDAEDATTDGVPGARRTVTAVVPGRGWTEAPVDFLAVGCRSAGCGGAGGDIDDRGDRATVDATPDTVSYRLHGRPVRRIRLRGVDLHAPEGSVVLTEPGPHRLTLSRVRSDGVDERVVVVRRGTPAGVDRAPR